MTESTAVHKIGHLAEPEVWTVSEYIERCRQAIEAGQIPPDYASHDERVAAMEEFPMHRHYWRPSAAEVINEGLSPHFGRDPEPFPISFCERFAMTMTARPEFLLAIRSLLEAVDLPEGGDE